MISLIEALKNADIPVPSKDTETFRIVRWGRNNRYWLKKFEGGYVFGDFVTGLNDHIFEQKFKGSHSKKAQEKLQKALQEVESRSAKIYDASATKANFIFTTATPIIKNDYLERKKVDFRDLMQELKEYKNCLVIPLRDVEGKLWTLQFIDNEGNKRFLSGGKKKGCFFLIGSLNEFERAFICEGLATGAAIHESIKEPVIVAFDSGNLKPVVQAIREKYPKLKIIICADNDCYHKNGINSGIDKAKEAARVVKGSVVFPVFKDSSTHPTDFNDLFVFEGKEAVQAIIKESIKVNDSISDIPEGFLLSDEGLFCVDIKSGKTTRISNYIKVIAFAKNNNEISKLLEFRDYKNELQRMIVKPRMIAKDGEQIRVQLVGRGFIYSGSSLSKRKLFEYISSSVPQKEAILLAKTGFFEDAYVRSDCIIGKSKNEIILDESIHDSTVTAEGNLRNWNDFIAKCCIGNSRLIFAISSAFASLLLNPCDMSNFGFHFVGNSSSGKTTCLNVAASVFGSPEYVVTWKATDNALENVAFKRNDALLILDELSEISPSKAGEVAYMLSNGQGKKRLDKNCNARETLVWRLIFLSSGEVDLASHMAEESKTSKAGQKIRLLNIPAKADNKSFGIFEELHNFKDGSEFSNYLRACTAKYYGTPAIAFTEKVLQEKEHLFDLYQEEFQKLKVKYLPEKSEGQDMRAFEKFMLVGFAGELAIKYGIICWKPNTAYQAAVACFNSWLEDKEGVGDDENRQILEHVKSFFELHAHSRFFDLDGFSDQKISNMAGYKSVYKDAVTFFVSPSVFQNEICKRFNRKSVITLLIEKGFLMKSNSGDCYQQKWTPYGNKKVYVISGKILL